MDNMAEWIEHLKHPLTLAGFGLFVLAAFLKPVLSNGDKLSGRASERLIKRSVNFVFILALLVIVGGFALSWRSKGTATGIVEQHTSGPKSPAIQGDNVEINYGGAPSSQTKQTKTDAGAAQKQETSAQVTQTTEGDKSPAINSSGNVRIHYEE